MVLVLLRLKSRYQQQRIRKEMSKLNEFMQSCDRKDDTLAKKKIKSEAQCQESQYVQIAGERSNRVAEANTPEHQRSQMSQNGSPKKNKEILMD